MALKKRKFGKEVRIFNDDLNCKFLLAESVVEAMFFVCRRNVFVTKEYQNDIGHHYGKSMKSYRIGQQEILRNEAFIMIQLFMLVM